MEPWILTVSGKIVHPLNPREDEIDIGDIAYALSGENRFSNHSYPRYKVAQHCVLISLNVPKFHALGALLHDASEAYLRDIARPVKQQPCMYEYRVLEDKLMAVISKKFGFPWPDKVVSEVDRRIAKDEAKYFMPTLPENFFGPGKNDDVKGLGLPYIHAWSSQECEARFMNRFQEITK